MDLVCQSCGAPAKPNLVECEFCEKPISADAAANAVPCPQCKALNAGGQQQCHKCKAWLVVQCVFCSHLSPHTKPACVQCNEPFAGAPERKAQRDSAQRNQQIMSAVGAVAPAAGGLLGGIAGAILGDRVVHSGPHYGAPQYGQPGYGQGYGSHPTGYGPGHQGYSNPGYGGEARSDWEQGGTDNFHRTHDAQSFGGSSDEGGRSRGKYDDAGGRSRGFSSDDDDSGGRSRGFSSSDDDDSGGRSRGSSSSDDDDDSGGRSRGSSSDDDRADDDGGRSRDDD